MAVIDCPSPTAGAGDVVAAALPNLKCLRKVTVEHMNPVPVLQTVGLCGKLQEVSVINNPWYHKVLMCVSYCLGSWNGSLLDVFVCVRVCVHGSKSVMKLN